MVRWTVLVAAVWAATVWGAEPKPAPPEDLRVERLDDGRVSVTWQSVAGPVLEYRVYRAVAGNPPALVARVPPSDRARQRYVDRVPLAAGYTYRYWVAALGPGGAAGALSKPVGYEPPDHRPPARPVITGLSVLEGRIRVQWSPPADPDVAGFHVYRAESPSEEFARLTGQPLRARAYDDTSVLGGRLYRYAVSAVDRSGNESARSRPRSARAWARVEPRPPQGLSVRKGTEGPALTWRAVDSPDLRGYVVYRAWSRDGGFVKISGVLEEPRFEDRQAPPTGTCWYRVRALYRRGILSDPSGPVAWSPRPDGGKP
ncbi:fibronectin type III domain-containing protein [Deferrisoma camini]|uniref:fibronectin type III domain-containing protein n=1 Tax=Deferrisoma camini TaxID=1035120 RepID=UPI00046D66CB|nr:hypothetical protein [Deferrisoma camini]